MIKKDSHIHARVSKNTRMQIEALAESKDLAVSVTLQLVINEAYKKAIKKGNLKVDTIN